jgi:hypothetical protein
MVATTNPGLTYTICVLGSKRARLDCLVAKIAIFTQNLQNNGNPLKATAPVPLKSKTQVSSLQTVQEQAHNFYVKRTSAGNGWVLTD